MKTCRKCGETRALNDFNTRYKANGETTLSVCKYCCTHNYLGQGVGYIRARLGIPAARITPELYELKAAQIYAKNLSKEIKTKLKENTK